MLLMLDPNVPLEAGWLKVRLMRPSTLYIGWEGLTPPGADLFYLDRWMLLHPTIKIRMTFGRLQGGT